MGWIFEVTIEYEEKDEENNGQTVTRNMIHHVEADNIEDVFMDFHTDTMDQGVTIVSIVRKVPVSRHIIPNLYRDTLGGW